MKMSKILMVFIIGIISLNVIFAGSIQKSFLIKGDFTETPAAINACNLGTSGDCKIFITDPNETDITEGSQFLGANRGNIVAEIKSNLRAGITTPVLNITSTAPTVNFIITIKKGHPNYNTTLLTTTVTVPNPNALNNNISSDLMIQFTGNCNSINLNKIKINDDGEIAKCYFDPADGYMWNTFASSSTAFDFHSTFHQQQFQKCSPAGCFVDGNIIPGSQNKIMLMPKGINSYAINDEVLNYDHLNNNLKIGYDFVTNLIDVNFNPSNYISNDNFSSLTSDFISAAEDIGTDLIVDASGKLNVNYSSIADDVNLINAGNSYITVQTPDGPRVIQAYILPITSNYKISYTLGTYNDLSAVINLPGDLLKTNNAAGYPLPIAYLYVQTNSQYNECKWEYKRNCLGDGYNNNWAPVPKNKMLKNGTALSNPGTFSPDNCGYGPNSGLRVLNIKPFTDTVCEDISDNLHTAKIQLRLTLRPTSTSTNTPPMVTILGLSNQIRPDFSNTVNPAYDTNLNIKNIYCLNDSSQIVGRTYTLTFAEKAKIICAKNQTTSQTEWAGDSKNKRFYYAFYNEPTLPSINYASNDYNNGVAFWPGLNIMNKLSSDNQNCINLSDMMMPSLTVYKTYWKSLTETDDEFYSRSRNEFSNMVRSKLPGYSIFSNNTSDYANSLYIKLVRIEDTHQTQSFYRYDSNSSTDRILKPITVTIETKNISQHSGCNYC